MKKPKLLPWHKRGANARKNPGDWMEDLFELDYEHRFDRHLRRWVKRMQRRFWRAAIESGC